jgi:hypothetical protein
MPKLYRECKQCQNEFYITDRDQQYFTSRDLELPKRCWSCRQRNKREAQQEIAKQKEAERMQRNTQRKSRTPTRRRTQNHRPSEPGFDEDGPVQFFVPDDR